MDRVQCAERALLATAICARVVGASLKEYDPPLTTVANQVVELIEPFVFLLPGNVSLYQPVAKQTDKVFHGCLKIRSRRSPCSSRHLQTPIDAAVHLISASTVCGLLHEAALLLARHSILELPHVTGTAMEKDNKQLIAAATRCADLVQPCDADLRAAARKLQDDVLKKCPLDEEERVYNFMNRGAHSVATSTARNAVDQLDSLVHRYEDDDILNSAMCELKQVALAGHLSRLITMRP